MGMMTRNLYVQYSSLANHGVNFLVYYKTFLDEHIQRLKENNVSSIQARDDHKWQKVNSSNGQDPAMKQQEKATTSAQNLLKHF